MEKILERLKKVLIASGWKDDSPIFAEADVDIDASVKEHTEKVRAVLANELESKIKSEADLGGKKFAYKAFKEFMAAKMGKKLTDFSDDTKWEDMANVFWDSAEKRGEGKTGDKTAPEIKQQLIDLQNEKNALALQLEEKDKALAEVPVKFEQFKTDYQTDFERTQFVKGLSEKATKPLKTTNPEHNFKIVKDDFFAKYDIVKENGEWRLYKKGQPGIFIPKSATEHMSVQDAYLAELEQADCYAKSNTTTQTTTTAATVVTPTGPADKEGFKLAPHAQASRDAARAKMTAPAE